MLFGVTRQLALSTFKYTKYYISDILTESFQFIRIIHMFYESW